MFKSSCNSIWHIRLPGDENYSTSKAFCTEQQRCHETRTRWGTQLVVLGTPRLSSVTAVLRKASFSHWRLCGAAGFLDAIPEGRGIQEPCCPAFLWLSSSGLHLPLVAAPPGGREPNMGGCSSSPSGRELAWGSERPQLLLVTCAEVSAVAHNTHC